jgi:hypothetical protein
VTCLLKARIAEPIAREWLGKHTSAMTNMHATTEELLEAVFSVWSVPRLHTGNQT